MDLSKIKRVFFFKPHNGVYKEFQMYYEQALEVFCNKNSISYICLDAKMKWFKPLRRIKFIIKKILLPSRFLPDFNNHVGQYMLKLTDDSVVKVAIDSHDNKKICSDTTFEWADVYFKSNVWGQVEYPEKVYPIINGNALLTVEYIKKIKKLRRKEKKVDLTFISRVWGGREHNIRLFEHLAKIKCSKNLLAIFLDGDRDQKETPDYINRLNKAGVEYTFEINPYSYGKLLEMMSESKLIVIRAGKHLCIPWRMIDLLCLGNCIVTESTPYPVWPVPLVEGQNYFNFGIERPIDRSPGKMTDYERIPDKVNEILENEELINSISANNEKYFDDHVAPDKLAEYIFKNIDAAVNKGR